MTPASGWHPDDYYRASRAARKAWQATNQQLEIAGVEDGAARSGEADAAPSPTPEEERRAAMMYGPGDTTIEWEPEDFDDLYVPPEAGVEDGAAVWGKQPAAPSSTPVPPLDGCRKVHAAAVSPRRGR